MFPVMLLGSPRPSLHRLPIEGNHPDDDVMAQLQDSADGE
jgi:hypothetical protein